MKSTSRIIKLERKFESIPRFRWHKYADTTIKLLERFINPKDFREILNTGGFWEELKLKDQFIDDSLNERAKELIKENI